VSERLPPFLALAALLALGGCAGGPAARPDGESVEPDRGADSSVVDFSLKDLTGKPVRLSALRGKVVLVSFWASWCEPCQLELARLQEQWKELRARGYELLTVCADPADSEGAVRQLVRRYRYEFPVLLDQESRVSDRYNPTMDLPFGLLLDRQGHVTARHQGYRPGDELTIRREVEELLAR
jgi:peroxiredoxin